MKEPVFLAHDWFPKPLPPNVTIGERSWLYSSFAFLHYRSQRPCGVQIGNDSGVYHGSFFELGPDGEVTVGNYCTLVGAIVSCNARVVIRDYAFIAHEVVIADSFRATPVEEPNQMEVGSAVTPQTSIVIGENSWIGARAVLLAGAKIGEGAIVGAATVINFDVPPYTVVAGNPARIVSHLRPKT